MACRQAESARRFACRQKPCQAPIQPRNLFHSAVVTGHHFPLVTATDSRYPAVRSGDRNPSRTQSVVFQQIPHTLLFDLRSGYEGCACTNHVFA